MSSDSWLSAWAKSGTDDSGTLTGWLPLFQHLDDAAAVAGLLVDQWVSRQVLARIGREFPGGVADARLLIVWSASVHDVGKISPSFSIQVATLADHMRRQGLAANPLLAGASDRSLVGHALVGHLAVRDWLADELGFDFSGVASQLGSIVASHHGVPPLPGDVSFAEDSSGLVGTGVWAQARVALLERAVQRVGGREVLAQLRDVSLSVPAQTLITAIVIVADWIASNPEFFPLWPLSSLDGPLVKPDEEVTVERAKAGWAAVSLPGRWAAGAVDGDVEALFQARFDRPGGVVRSVQVAAVEAAREMRGPGMVVIEAPMGSGKTEAALMAAEVLAAASGAEGCFVALPTQATTDAMFSRVRRWLERLPGCVNDERVSVSLAHGKARLNEEFDGLVRKGRFTSVGDGDECGVVAHQWLSGRKKAGLASFVVGTIDQVLFAGLKSRHVMLRHLALAGKVVIIDEVHAYDVYMSRYLCRVLHWLGAYGVPVVLLSATLPDVRREELVRAYDSGRGDGVATATVSGYPVVTATGVSPRVLELPDESAVVAMDRLSDDLDALVAYLDGHLGDGGCAVVVRNTVARVQETADRLASVFGADAVTINHARFLAHDRSLRDQDLLARFGPVESGAVRPMRHIVVASQVVEQSLDVDFDLMITDLAPMDLLLQRMGRLHRHDRVRPEGVSSPRCAVVGVQDWAAAPVSPVDGSVKVYEEFPLLRAAALLVDRDSIRLPHDIAELVQRAYGDDTVGPPDWLERLEVARSAAVASARARVEAAKVFLLDEASEAETLVGWLRAGVGDAEDDPRGVAQVRDGQDSLEVLVVERDPDDGLLVPSWVKGGGTQIPLDEMVSWGQAKAIAACSLRLPLALSHGGVIDEVIRELELRHRYSSFDRNPLLKGQLVLALDSDRTTELCGYALTYDLHKGLVHERSGRAA
ncbi:CRISPR-associated helicase Cas3 [Alloactinosynnema sp. L-07]|uniref:CRISPR-associated helicase/endonuclease Cas3 n=1 Tax=Alloactinosynnema sp. L-07 TaxID=1653480 RepID=UPI00065EFCC4|nr:CRISPR-associated helicase/endonuclease Cas3 [Alloactinosynnema sp. L-07]CRK59250.1 CRISPR-associated helicase Cas3 [Alloactinosynnema sp. L-07]